ncbi:MAG: transglutaminase-like domain-containing protein [Zoogloeaceae bacterium]|nr:transglutaminase-like domain-containing protein [Zoogloeaceae bacterium]
MKRRAFLATGLLALMSSPAALAAPAKTAKKPTAKKTTRKSNANVKKTPKAAPARVQTNAEKSVLDAAPDGSSASRLPPVKAPALPTEWRRFAITLTAQINPSRHRQRLWLPLPISQDGLYQRDQQLVWQGNFMEGGILRLPDGELEAFSCEWSPGIAPRLELTATLETADRQFDVSRRTRPPERDDILRRNLLASAQLPNNGEAHTLAVRIVGRIIDPVAQARALFEWVVDNSTYDPDLPACGKGDVHAQIASKSYGGRSADINGLFVALCRALGIPARRVFGLRIAPSRLAACLGVERDATYATHCRAEFYVPGYGWIPADPSDACRAMRLEKHLSPEDSRALRKILFGVWEMNWLVYNRAESLTLPGLPTLPFFITPQLERQEVATEGLDLDGFRYHIESRSVQE